MYMYQKEKKGKENIYEDIYFLKYRNSIHSKQAYQRPHYCGTIDMESC